ncbi:MAG: nucleotidyl transferase AbiEii/AbiGii toxin family protein [Candidatus Altiarchaeota archaeon]|nr:nucleotidyl transferase AbiEii/AbiGii toxin family protein [Candidatus Altiarchaeota archaeon]
MIYEESLKKEEIKKRRRQHGFAQDWLIEIFIWEFEVLNRLGKNFILKGGAATQLFLPLKDQRASVDIDVVTDLSKSGIERVFTDMKEFKVKKHIPKAFNQNLPLVTYLIKVPSVTRGGLTIKVDVLIEKDTPFIEIREKNLFALTARNVRCIPKSYLIAEKFLTLAINTIGIPTNRKEQIPKHIYDLIKLTEKIDLKAFSEIPHHMNQIVKRESRYKGARYETPKIIDDINKTIERYVKLEPEIKKDVFDFQSIYINRLNRMRLSEWKLNLLRTKYLLDMIGNSIRDKNPKKNLGEYEKTIKKMVEIKGLDREAKKDMKERLLKKIREEHRKRLKGASIERIYLELKTT